MPRNWTLPLALLLATGLAAQKSETLIVHFPLASAELAAADEAALRALCDRADIARVTGVTLKGHTDVRGSIAYNEALSERRAESVREALQGTCLKDKPVGLDWSGELEPLTEAANETAHASNRRVEVHLAFDGADLSSSAVLRHPKVTPLMPAADRAQERFIVDASKPIDLVASDGVHVRIPAGAILDAKGNAVTGDVYLSYRSFNTPWEAIASGIPMHMGHGDDAGHMESLGMFEVLAAQNGTPLKLRAGEAISITLPETVIRDEAYKDLMLDPITGEWIEQQDPSAALTSSANRLVPLSQLTSACAQYGQAMTGLPQYPDTTRFLKRMASDGYCMTTACESAAKPYKTRKSLVVSPYDDNDIPAIQVVMDRSVFRGRSISGFRLVFQNPRQHSEWQAFTRDKLWVYDGPLTKKEFRAQIARKHFYQDVYLEVSDNGERGVVRLKDRGRWIELPVDLRFYQETKEDAAEWQQQLADYEGRFEAKRSRFDRRLGEKVSMVKERIEREKHDAWLSARIMMTDDELAMNEEEFDRYAQTAYTNEVVMSLAYRTPATTADMETASTITSSFAMRGFGVYNCDQILRRRAIEPAAVAVFDEKGERFGWSLAYGVIDGRKAVITYWGNGYGRNDQMRLSRDMSSVLFVGENGRLLLVERPGEQVKGPIVKLQGRQVEQPASPKELQELASK